MKEIKNKDIVYDVLKVLLTHPQNNAFFIEDQAYTYGELGNQIGAIQDCLVRLPDTVIGIMAENNIQTYSSILAVLMSGKTYVILHPSYPEDRNLRIAKLAGLQHVLCLSTLEQNRLGDNSIRFIAIESLPPLSIEKLKYQVDGAANAYLIFTSGSTGEPKGVPISRNNLNAFYDAYGKLGWKLSEKDRMLQMFELTFDVSVVSLLYPLTLGACVYTVGYKEVKYLKVFELLESYEITFASVTPSLLQLMSPYFEEIQLPSLKYLIVTAEASHKELLERFRDSAPNAEFVNLYGPSEATIYCTYYRIPSQNCKHYNGMIAIGKPFDGMEIMIVDEDGNSLPTDQMGELWVSGPQVMNGYLNDPKKSALALIQAVDGKTYYKTGDLCIQNADGDLIYCGRKDSQVKIQGFRIELGEIEYTAKHFLSNAHNVVVLPTTREGICSELHLVIEAETFDSVGLLQFLSKKLPKYMLPKQVHSIPQFPVNTSNKIDRKRIAQLISIKND